ncbi:hypothetical protein LTR36_004375 [Oleoguttula mirabilis]|uniref:Uncharacterized protein n=1 Tax=Oleoguttula mirabilis TaxID=1507867 RepID=A0AAV9JG96_9PEZI|nr:hypothetical protein LTR36_004375 [Oleoguttula mirabilis]
MFAFDAPKREEAGFMYHTYVQGEVFDVLAQKGELWLAKNQDDPDSTLGWIWDQHFVVLTTETSQSNPADKRPGLLYFQSQRTMKTFVPARAQSQISEVMNLARARLKLADEGQQYLVRLQVSEKVHHAPVMPPDTTVGALGLLYLDLEALGLLDLVLELPLPVQAKVQLKSESATALTGRWRIERVHDDGTYDLTSFGGKKKGVHFENLMPR